MLWCSVTWFLSKAFTDTSKVRILALHLSLFTYHFIDFNDNVLKSLMRLLLLQGCVFIRFPCYFKVWRKTPTNCGHHRAHNKTPSSNIISVNYNSLSFNIVLPLNGFIVNSACQVPKLNYNPHLLKPWERTPPHWLNLRSNTVKEALYDLVLFFLVRWLNSVYSFDRDQVLPSKWTPRSRT